MNKKDIIAYFNDKYLLNAEQKLYLQIHTKRFETVLSYIKNKSFTKVLDIGPSYLSELLLKQFPHNLTLLGFDEKESVGGHLPNTNLLKAVPLVVQDLNFWQAYADDQLQQYDLIICAEVMEHLYSSPSQLFKNLSASLVKNGMLIIQTPNAVSLRKRSMMVLGKNPFEMPRENFKNPGHFREYTLKELQNLGKINGLKIEKTILDEYFEYPSLLSKCYRSFKFLLPNTLKSGITIIYKKQ